MNFQKPSSIESLPNTADKAILLSIKPKYANLILDGSKRIEFRRSWAKKNIDLIVLYSTSPIRKIVGLVKVESVICSYIELLWEKCQPQNDGITRDEFFSYFAGKEKGTALLLGPVLKLSSPIEPNEIFRDFSAPQSFMYLTSVDYENLENKIGGIKEKL